MTEASRCAPRNEPSWLIVENSLGSGSYMRDALKAETQQIHETVDDAFSTLDLTKRADFAVFLTAHHLAYSALKQSCPWPSFISGELDGLQDQITADLGNLECPRASAVFRPELAIFDPLGVGYVIGGSHFGKRVLRKRWSRTTDGRVRAADQYLNTDLLDRVWAKTITALDEPCLDDPRKEIVAASATATFELFYSGYLTALDIHKRTSTAA